MIDIPFATSRAPTSDGGFSGVPAENLTFGIASVRLHSEDAVKIQIFRDANKRVNSIKPTENNVAGFLENAKKSRLLPLVFVHGYDTDFYQALCYAAQININMSTALASISADVKNDVQGVSVFLISWPSLGSWYRYGADGKTVATQGQVLAPLWKMFAQPGVAHNEQVSWLCQSKGSAILERIYQYLKPDLRGSGQSIFNTLFLTGADIGTDAFDREESLKGLCGWAKRVEVYYNSTDTLGLAARLFRGVKPMSRYGVVNTTVAPNLYATDAASLIDRSNDWLGHYYARMNPHVQRSMIESLVGK
jgi:esterase/lipase superfamily enzyme